MLFTSRNSAESIMQTGNIEKVLSQISRTIVKKESNGINDVNNVYMMTNSSLLPKAQKGDMSERESQLLKILHHHEDGNAGHLPPTYTNYWLAQRDPDYVNQEEDETDVLRRCQKNALNPAQGVMNYWGQWISGNDTKRSRKTILQNFDVSGTQPGVFPSPPMGSHDHSSNSSSSNGHSTGVRPSGRRMGRKLNAYLQREII